MLDIGQAVMAMRDGRRVARKGWNGKGMYLRLYNPQLDKAFPMVEKGPSECTPIEWVGMKTADNKFVPWLCSQTDLLAYDWECLPEAEDAQTQLKFPEAVQAYGHEAVINMAPRPSTPPILSGPTHKWVLVSVSNGEVWFYAGPHDRDTIKLSKRLEDAVQYSTFGEANRMKGTHHAVGEGLPDGGMRNIYPEQAQFNS